MGGLPVYPGSDGGALGAYKSTTDEDDQAEYGNDAILLGMTL